MHNIAAFEAKTHFSEILEQASKGERFVITKHGHPVAQLIPFSDENIADVGNTINQLHQFALKHKLKLSGLDWKKLRDEGRKS